jgi:hypothetical protein
MPGVLQHFDLLTWRRFAGLSCESARCASRLAEQLPLGP